MRLDNYAAIADKIWSGLERLAGGEPLALDQSVYQDVRQSLKQALNPNSAAESRQVHILLSDLRGFTAMSEKYSPLSVIQLLNRYFTIMGDIIERHGGQIDKFMGDSIMAVFSMDSESQQELPSVISCAIEMQLAMASINQVSRQLGMAKLYMGIGINSGEVVAGTLGSSNYREYTVIGEQVNLASRVEAHSLRGQVLLSENTYLKAKDFIQVGDIAQVWVKGRKKPVTLYELVAQTQPSYRALPVREIRKSPRVDAHLEVTFQLVKDKQVLPRRYLGIALDVSFGGLFIQVDHMLAQFTELKLQINLPDIDQADIYARVLVCNHFQDMFEVHLEFTSLSEHSHQAIKQYVNQQL